MARIDRRVSPNQTALWTVYELISIQARRVATLVTVMAKKRHRPLITVPRRLRQVVRRMIARVCVIAAPPKTRHA